jgi:uncharacterized damage-inducible protein DinB
MPVRVFFYADRYSDTWQHEHGGDVGADRETGGGGDQRGPAARIGAMLEMLRDLIHHKGHANASLLNAIRQNPAAAFDSELRELLHHILLANRFWLLTVEGQTFVLEAESLPASSFEALIQRFARTQSQEAAWFDAATPADLERILSNPLIPNSECSVAQAFMQVCLHSHGHRAQAAKLLRRHGGTPPVTDFIRWLTDRPRPEWPQDLAAETPSSIQGQQP